VHLVTQIDEEEEREPRTADNAPAAAPSTVLQRVLDGHVERRVALEEKLGTSHCVD
jgi:hypothetical protein